MHSSMAGGEQPTTIGGTVLPESHEEQVQLGFRMIQNSFSTKVAQLENELRGLKMGCEEQKGQATNLQRKNSALEVELVESHQRGSQLTEENRELFKTVQNLRRQLAKLEGLKKKVLSSITDEGDDEEYQQQQHHLQQLQSSNYSLGMGGGGGAAYEPAAASRAKSPPRPPAFGVGPGESFSGGTGSASRPSSPPPGGGIGGVVDGKQFFRQARSQLSYEAFNDFLANIKRLNNQQQSREATLEEARRIFGPELAHLYKEFEQLLNRHAV